MDQIIAFTHYGVQQPLSVMNASMPGLSEILDEPADCVNLENASRGAECEDMRAMRQLSQTGAAKSVSEPSEAAGRGKTVEIGTYNVEWMGCEAAVGGKPKTDKEYREMAEIIRNSGADVMGLEEVGTEEAVKRLLANLPGYDYILGSDDGFKDNKSQRLAVIFDTSKVQCDRTSIEEIEEVSVPEMAGKGRLRSPLAVKMKAGEFDFTLVVCHQKARFDARSIKIRTAQAEILNRWVEKKVAGGEKDVIVVGDYNDMLENLSFKKFESLFFVTKEAADKGEGSNVKFNSLIDHIGATSESGGAAENFVTGSVMLPDIKPYPNYVKRISDHRPVVASFRVDSDKD